MVGKTTKQHKENPMKRTGHIEIFEKSAHSPQYEEVNLFDAELLKWLKET